MTATPLRRFPDPKIIPYPDGSRWHTSVTRAFFLESANILACVRIKHRDGLTTALQGELAGMFEALVRLQGLDKVEDDILTDSQATANLTLIGLKGILPLSCAGGGARFAFSNDLALMPAILPAILPAVPYWIMPFSV